MDPSVDKNKVKLKNLGQTSAWFCLAKGEKYIYQLWQIHVTNKYENSTTQFNTSKESSSSSHARVASVKSYNEDVENTPPKNAFFRALTEKGDGEAPARIVGTFSPTVFLVYFFTNVNVLYSGLLFRLNIYVSLPSSNILQTLQSSISIDI